MSDPSDWAAPGHDKRPADAGWAPPPPGQGHPQGPQAAPKPGVIPLRPLGVTEILDGAISFIRSNPRVTLVLSAAVMAITQLVQVSVTVLIFDRMAAVIVGSPAESVDPADIAGVVASAAGGAIGSGLVTFIAITILTGLLVMALGQAVLGRKMPLAKVWEATKGRIPGLLGLSLLTSLLLVVVVALGFAPVVIAAVAGAPGPAVIIIGVVGVVAAICLAIFLGVAWSMITPAYVLEGIPAMTTFRRSYRLVLPRWWRVFGIVLLAAIITAVVSSVLSVPFTLLSTLFGNSLDPTADITATPSLLGLVVTTIGTIIAGTITSPFSAGVTGLLYIDQRMRREAFDLELLQAAQSPPQQ